MTTKKEYILFYMAKLPLLLLYVSFFIVQLFYNFDTGNHLLPLAKTSFQKKALQKNGSTIVKSARNSGTAIVVFRLNKRYHPQAAITCNAVILTPVICAVSSKLHVHYSSGFTPSFYAPAETLRGPPVVA